MAESPSEMCSELEEQRDALKAYAAELYEKLRWNIGISIVMLQEAGGVVEIEKEVLESINIDTVQLMVRYDEEREIYIVEGVFEDGSEPVSESNG